MFPLPIPNINYQDFLVSYLKYREDTFGDKTLQASTKNLLELAEIYIQRGSQAPINLKEFATEGTKFEKATPEGEALLDAYKDDLRRRKYEGIYDAIKCSSPYNRCPTCWIGEVNQVDHYIPSSSFPEFAIFAPNLAPSCSTCNQHKLHTFSPEQENQFINVYFDQDIFNVTWLSCVCTEVDSDIIPKFSLVKSPSLKEENFKRLENHFRRTNLLKRIAIAAQGEYSNRRGQIERLKSNKSMLIAELEKTSEDFLKSNQNHYQGIFWKSLTELYQSII